MPVAITERPVQTDPPRKVWTREQCQALSACRALDYEQLELVEGELINKMGKNRPHINSLALLLRWLQTTFGAQFVLSESTIDVSPEDNPTSEPQPDLVVLDRDFVFFISENPRPANIRLLIEIADTTVGFDLNTKAGLYARAGIPDYWVLDILGRRMIVHREPHNGRYKSVVAYRSDESVAPLAAPTSPFRVAAAFPG